SIFHANTFSLAALSSHSRISNLNCCHFFSACCSSNWQSVSGHLCHWITPLYSIAIFPFPSHKHIIVFSFRLFRLILLIQRYHSFLKQFFPHSFHIFRLSVFLNN